MKTYYFILLMVVTFGYVQDAVAMSMADPITVAMMNSLAQDEIPTESMCPDNYKAIAQIKVQAVRSQMALSPVLIGKLPDPHSAVGIEDLLVEHCQKNEDIKKIGESLSENVQKCLTGKSNISSDKLEKLKTDSVTITCAGASSMVSWDIMNRNIAEGRTPDGKLP
ncbi:uncharacterized protein LOC122500800 [Leptopilina heterotoma]|uniref:uncharacterized protein LOC122500800 n=1 Tax=Leptopilina heterotoma TaxID=63436 RepID=UPI001CA970EF|nr:uncharacterized protein LOC122500800 [Leptopilina heterotoma]